MSLTLGSDQQTRTKTHAIFADTFPITATISNLLYTSLLRLNLESSSEVFDISAVD